MSASAEGRVLLVESGDQQLEVKDILVGDVWLCSGQSNMEMGIKSCNEEEEIAQANHPNLRLLTVPHKVAYSPQELFKGSWKRCTPESIQNEGAAGFSAAAYFFGKNCNKNSTFPLG